MDPVSVNPARFSWLFINHSVLIYPTARTQQLLFFFLDSFLFPSCCVTFKLQVVGSIYTAVIISYVTLIIIRYVNSSTNFLHASSSSQSYKYMFWKTAEMLWILPSSGTLSSVGWTAWPLKMEMISSLETSILNQSTLRNIPEDGRIHVRRSESLRSRELHFD
jgi:hypothetical protein